MRLTKDQAEGTKQNSPVYREIPQAEAPAAEPGAVGQAAVNAAALQQLNRYADEIEQYVNASNMRLLLNRIQGELKKDEPDKQPKMRLRRE